MKLYVELIQFLTGLNHNKFLPFFYSSTNFCRKLKNWFRTYIYQRGENKHRTDMTQLKRWERDFQLEKLSRLHLFDEYIEMSKSPANCIAL